MKPLSDPLPKYDAVIKSEHFGHRDFADDCYEQVTMSACSKDFSTGNHCSGMMVFPDWYADHERAWLCYGYNKEGVLQWRWAGFDAEGRFEYSDGSGSQRAVTWTSLRRR